MRVRVRFFAGTREAAGTSADELELPEGASVGGLFDALIKTRPRLGAYRPHALVAVNGTFVPDERALADGDEVAIMPPVSGGAIVAEAPSLDTLVASLRKEEAGAVVAFLGLVRPTSGERRSTRVQALEFEVYREMAEASLVDVQQEAVSKFGLLDCRLEHRTGTLALGEPIVAVAVSARHREEAFDAAQWVMRELKTRVPIWKREHADDGTSHWVNDPHHEEARHD